MAGTIGIGCQDFEKIRKSNNFYVDKTKFIKEWWEELFEGLSIWEEKTYRQLQGTYIYQKYVQLYV